MTDNNFRKPFVCIDFDGVLAEYTGYQGPEHFGKPIKGAKEFLQKLNKVGLSFVILTTRPIEEVEQWMIKYNMPQPKEITNTKIPAPVYIDDGAIRFNGDFEQLLKELKGFKPHWKKSSIFSKFFD